MLDSLEMRSALRVRQLYKEGGYRNVLENLYFIRDKQASVHLIELNRAQRDFIEKMEKQLRETGRVRIIVLKARQLGMSTLAQGIEMTEKFRRSNNFGLVLSHEGGSAKYLYNMNRRALAEKWPLGPIKLKKDRLDGMEIGPPVNSTTETATAKNAGSGRSRTIQFLHASECGFYDNAETLMLGMLQSVPDFGSVVILESTANGIGNWFHKQWELAEAGQSSFIPLFYPWHEHEEYRFEFSSVEDRAAFVQTYSKVEEEISREFELSPEQMKWRRMTIIDKCEGDATMFKQEHPMTPDEAFIVSGRPVFDPDNMKKILDKARKTEPISKGYVAPDGAGIVEEESGPLWIYELPDPDEDYALGIDTAEGKIRSRDAGFMDVSGRDPDFNAACVIRMSDGVEVARYMSNYSPGLYSADMISLGYFYGIASQCKEPALLIPERNSIGQAVIDDFMEAQYPRLFVHKTFNRFSADGGWTKNIGFRTGVDNRDILIKDLQTEIMEGNSGITDRTTAKHVSSMRRNSMGKAEAASGAHDDLAFAYMLAKIGRREVRIEAGLEEVDRRPSRTEAERDADFAAKVYGSDVDGFDEEVDPAEDHPW